MSNTGESHRRRFQSDSGFTLLELLAVIAIIGILAAIALPAISRIRERARIGATKAQLAQIETALEEYYAEWDTYPPMGNDWLGGGFFPSEDVGTDGKGPFKWNPGALKWEVNTAYKGPDEDGTEGNYYLDPGEDTGLDPSGANGPGRLDGTYYDRLAMFTGTDTQALIDFFADRTYYHYYAGYVRGKTSLGMPKFRSYDGLSGYMDNHPPYYNRWVIYSVGLDGKDHGLHNYYLVMQDGEDVGADGYASDVMDDGEGTPNLTSDNDGILFEPSIGENSPDGSDTQFRVGIVRETGWKTPGEDKDGNDIFERQAPAGNSSVMEGPKGEPVFSYDVRMKRRRDGQVYAMPDGDGAAFGMIMRYGP